MNKILAGAVNGVILVGFSTWVGCALVRTLIADGWSQQVLRK